MNVDVVRAAELGEGALERWNAIQDSDPGLASPFLSSEFTLAVARARPDTRVAVLADDAGIIGFFPFELHSRGAARALAHGLSDVQASVVPGGVDLDLARVLEGCGIRRWDFDHLLAHEEPRLRGVAHRLHHERSPTLDLSAGWDAYEQAKRTSSASLLQSTARKKRKLEREHGEATFVFAEQDRRVLDLALRWKSDQYRRTGRRDRFADESTLGLVHDLLDVSDPAFGAPLCVLRAGGRIVAAHLGLRSRTTVAWWFPVYDPAYAAYSPGLILCIELARAMRDHGLSLLDLGKGDEAYKDRLSNSEIRLLRGFAARSEREARLTIVRRWPREQALTAVLESPPLRRIARASLRMYGAVRPARRET